MSNCFENTYIQIGLATVKVAPARLLGTSNEEVLYGVCYIFRKALKMTHCLVSKCFEIGGNYFPKNDNIRTLAKATIPWNNYDDM